MSDYDKIQGAWGAISAAEACLRAVSAPTAEVADAIDGLAEAQSALRAWLIAIDEVGS